MAERTNSNNTMKDDWGEQIENTESEKKKTVSVQQLR